MSNVDPALNRNFLRAMGGCAPIRLQVDVVDEETGGPVLEYAQASVLVGGHPRADLRLEHPAVGKRHLFLILIGGRVFGVHLSPRAPTLWAGQAKPFGWVNPSDALGMGPFIVRWLGGDRSIASADPPHDPLAPGSFFGAPAALELVANGATRQRIVLDRTLTLVGNLSICAIRPNTSRASSVHCFLIQTEEGVWVQDLCSREGLSVNESSARLALLGEGDFLDIGGRRLRVRYERPPLQPSSITELSLRAESSHSFQGVGPVASPASHGPLAERPRLAADRESMERMLGPIFDRMADFQSQTFEQFQEMMTMMVRMFGAMLSKHREFVRGELDRFERMAHALAERQPASPEANKALPAGAVPGEGDSGAPAANGESWKLPLPPLEESPQSEQIHAWLQERINQLGENRATFWQKMLGLLRSPGSTVPQG
jgi:hypothetical protein